MRDEPCDSGPDFAMGRTGMVNFTKLCPDAQGL